MIVPHPHHEEHNRSQSYPDQLLQIVRGNSSLLSMCNAVDGEHTNTQDGQDQSHIAKIEVVESPAFRQPINHDFFATPYAQSVREESEVTNGT